MTGDPDELNIVSVYCCIQWWRTLVFQIIFSSSQQSVEPKLKTEKLQNQSQVTLKYYYITRYVAGLVMQMNGIYFISVLLYTVVENIG